MRRQIRLCLFLLGLLPALLPAKPFQRPPTHLPDFRFELLDGSVVSTSDLKGKVVVIDFWGTWCKPCLEEIPDYNAFYNGYKDQGVFLAALAVDSGPADRVRAAAKRLGIQYPVAAPSLSDLDVFGDISAVPTTLIADRSGRVQKVFQGTFSGKQKELRQIVDRLLKP